MYRSITNFEAMKRVGVAPLQVELRVARLKWLQYVVAWPQNHEQYITALMGEIDFEKKGDGDSLDLLSLHDLISGLDPLT